jgi:siroheme synthase-like protein
MSAFMVSLQVRGQRCLVVGGDEEALRRAKRLHECGAVVVAIATEFEDTYKSWILENQVSLHTREPMEEDFSPRPFLVVSSPRQEKLSSWIDAQCRLHGVLFCCIDQKPYYTFSHVGIGDVGALTLGIASDGAAPALVKRLRDALVAGLAGEFAAFSESLAALRARTPNALRRSTLEAALEGLAIEIKVTLPEAWRSKH